MISVGRYKEIYNDDSLPSAFENISDKSIRDKEKVLRYMKSIKPSSESPAILKDIFSKELLSIPLTCSNDDAYVWRSDVLYYFEKYNLKMPDSFIQHVLSKT